MTSPFYPAHVAEPLPTHGKLAIVKAFLEQICAGRGRVLQGITGSLRAQSNPVRIECVATFLPVGNGRLREPVEHGGPSQVLRAPAIFLRHAGTVVRRICKFLGTLSARSSSFLNAFVDHCREPSNAVANTFSLSPVLSSACLHVPTKAWSRQHDAQRNTASRASGASSYE